MTTPAAAPAAAAPAAAPAPATPSNVVFVGKIPATCGKPEISDFLAAAGTVKRVVIKKPRRIENVVYAFAEFEDAACVAKAVEILNGKELAGAAVVVETARNQFPRRRKFYKRRKAAPAAANGTPAAPAGNAPAPAGTAAPAEKKKTFRRRRPLRRRRRPVNDAPISKDVAYVGNLPYIVDEEHMKDIFEGCSFVEARVVRRARDNRSKGFGFVTFASEEEREKAIKIADGSVVEGRKIHVSPARERVEKPKTEEPAAASAAATPASN